MRQLFVFALCSLTGALLMAQGTPTPDESIQASNKSAAMRVFGEFSTRESSKLLKKSTRSI